MDAMVVIVIGVSFSICVDIMVGETFFGDMVVKVNGDILLTVAKCW